MSWFRTRPRLREQPRLHPHHASTMSHDLMAEISANHRRLLEHREQQKTQETKCDGKLHRR
jgi:hypothetical protein